MSSSYERWWWDKFLKALDEAGYRIVKKPEQGDIRKGGARGGVRS